MLIPHATYRIQLHEGFTFAHLDQILDYLHELGVSTIYASPVTQAVKGSMHGYDATNPAVIGPDIGTEEQWERLTHKLNAYGMNWLQDIVPNHMAFDSSNPWLFDVMERGTSSEFHDFFDIDWDHPDPLLRRRLMAPFLGDSLDACLQRREIRLDHTENGFLIRYFDSHYPVTPSCYSWLGEMTGDCPAYWLAFATHLEQMMSASFEAWQMAKRDLLDKAAADPDAAHFIAAVVSLFNESPRLLAALLARQCYSLTHHQLADTRIDYRRFFTINGLICLRMEDEKVFSRYHERFLDWYKRGFFQGLRIDHIDGLADPAQYTRRLKERFGKECYIIAEKILQADESLPRDWSLEGMTGYEFLFLVNQLMADPEGNRHLLDYYRRLVPSVPRYREEQFENKYEYLKRFMGGELDNLFRQLVNALRQAGLPVLETQRLREALAVLMACFPVYRIYPAESGISENGRRTLDEAFRRANQRKPDLAAEWTTLQDIFRPEHDSGAGGAIHAFRIRLMQFTGPLAAKGIEDTTFYTYDPLISHNEVGDTPGISGISVEDFHERMRIRQSSWPLSLNATSTHDTKRGEDARIRLNILSAIPEEWTDAVDGWRALNRSMIKKIGERQAPSVNDEYFIYQSLLGGVPYDLVITDSFRDRFRKFLVKALREARTETSWTEPNQAYENACLGFADAILAKNSKFQERFMAFAGNVIRQAAIYSMSQTLIKLTSPGIPDIYQGAELWDLSFVDPDNRRSVNYDRRRVLLKRIAEEEKKGLPALFEYLSANRASGVEKLFVIWKALAYRKSHPQLFIKGEYIPIRTDPNMISYLRRHEKDWLLVVVPLIRSERDKVKSIGIVHFDLPPDGPLDWKNEFTGQVFRGGRMPVSTALFAGFPVTLLSGRNG
ncbi:MAG: malto-oligosyltrehalose synthase [Bacteroidota bacterium]|nr:malto-oligosyltrehalose synthase [Bacteroidota bacterium]MDP4214614.1 malto-oligosyltrehalose synthase [Bacteroidota bacterium]MDP4259167.1 malto-oligosyltrehalose synthase [Bacteroidota bacterium]